MACTPRLHHCFGFCVSSCHPMGQLKLLLLARSASLSRGVRGAAFLAVALPLPVVCLSAQALTTPLQCAQPVPPQKRAGS